jgi:hypothetical protein
MLFCDLNMLKLNKTNEYTHAMLGVEPVHWRTIGVATAARQRKPTVFL